MEQHIFVTTLSTRPSEEALEKGKKENIVYRAYDKEFETHSIYTNETGLRFVKFELEKSNESLSKVFAFSTEQVKADKMLDTILEVTDSKGLSSEEVLLDDTSLAAAFKSMEEMFAKIQDCNKGDNKVRVHVDMTGGRRHAAMMMVGLIRLLRYSDIALGHVVYTNYDNHCVENAMEVMTMFDAIGGAEEFVEHGRIEGIRPLFKNGTDGSVKLTELLAALEKVSESLLWCGDKEAIKSALMGMEQKMKNYRVSKDSTSKEILFKALIPQIERSYDLLFKHKQKPELVTAVIRWCLEKKLYQQALTFFSEWMPSYLFEVKIFALKEGTEHQKRCEDEVKKQSRLSGKKPWENFFFRKYVPEFRASDNKWKGGKVKRVSRDTVMMSLLQKEELIISVQPEDFKKLVNDYCDLAKERNTTHHALNTQENIRKNREIINKINKYLDLVSKCRFGQR